MLGSRMSARAITASLACYTGYDSAAESSMAFAGWVVELATQECLAARVPLLVQLAGSVAAYAMQQPQVGSRHDALCDCVVCNSALSLRNR